MVQDRMASVMSKISTGNTLSGILQGAGPEKTSLASHARELVARWPDEKVPAVYSM